LNKVSLAQVIRWNTTITHIQDNVFRARRLGAGDGISIASTADSLADSPVDSRTSQAAFWFVPGNLTVSNTIRSSARDEPVIVQVASTNGTAESSSKDVTKSGSLTFAPGETTKTITIEVEGNDKQEANETFFLDLFGLSGNALFAKDRGIGTILNDD
jgi:hypothetical protein